MGCKNDKLHKAKRGKNDGFYTRLEDIEKEIVHYKDNLKNKIIYCPCDDYRWSNFYKYFKEHFDEYQLKELWSTNYNIGNGAYFARYDGKEEVVEPLLGNGDFRSPECTILKDKCDVVITNPPFSLMRDFVVWLDGQVFEERNGKVVRI